MPHPADGIFPERKELDEVFSLVYEELRRLASLVRCGDASATLNSTALVHEAWLKLRNSPHLAATSVPHFKAIAAKAMRQVLVDAARRRNAQKRGAGEVVELSPECSDPGSYSVDIDLLELDQALDRLATLNARQVHIIECRFFGGLSVSETADLLQVSESVIERDWRAARAWLISTVYLRKE
jgi:RNA polymerase sigma factor (TIGR02999 family)